VRDVIVPDVDAERAHAGCQVVGSGVQARVAVTQHRCAFVDRMAISGDDLASLVVEHKDGHVFDVVGRAAVGERGERQAVLAGPALAGGGHDDAVIGLRAEVVDLEIGTGPLECRFAAWLLAGLRETACHGGKNDRRFSDP
jgi:hypothetical protein